MDRERLERILEVLAGAARGELSHRLEPEDGEPEYVELEVAINSALEDLELARSRSDTQQREIDQKNQKLLSALYTPIIGVWPGVLTLPIIGAVDSARAANMLEAHHKSLILCIVEDGAKYSPESRHYFPSTAPHYQALATVVTSVVVRAAINFISRVSRQVGNFRMFNSETEAMRWLETQKSVG